MKISLVTGSDGFIGKHLVSHLEKRGDFVIKISRNPFESKFEKKGYILSDINDTKTINKIFLKYQPEEVYHLAAQSSPPQSFKNPIETLKVNYLGTKNILDASLSLKKLPRILNVSSSAVYASAGTSKKISETSECSPISPYGFSKLAAENLIELYFLQNKNFTVFNVRPFFIIGPGKEGDVCSDWARNIVQIESGKKNFLQTGDINNTRDFLHVDDAIKAFIKIIGSSKYGETFNICSGKGYSLKKIRDIFIRLSNKNIKTKMDVNKFRQVDNTTVIGDNAKLKSIGWIQTIPTKDALHDILNYWRTKNNI
jgi:GDP-4-dehydro-6-deoxy-D-mannose reductase